MKDYKYDKLGFIIMLVTSVCLTVIAFIVRSGSFGGFIFAMAHAFEFHYALKPRKLSLGTGQYYNRGIKSIFERLGRLEDFRRWMLIGYVIWMLSSIIGLATGWAGKIEVLF